MRLGRYRGRHLKPRPVRHGPAVVATVASLSLTTPVRAGTHLVRHGETLTGIAERYGTGITALARINRLADPDLIVAGTRLRIPGRARVSSVHVVQPGETLSGIAVRYRTSVTALARRNHLKDPNLIVIGTKLRVPRSQSAAAPTASAASIRRSLERQARTHGLSPALVKAVAWQESGWRQDVKSSAGAIGVMQVMPATARFVNRVLGGGHLRIHVADDNIHLGVMYLRHMLARFRTRKALAGYYSGPGAVRRRLNKVQRAYVTNVVALRNRFS